MGAAATKSLLFFEKVKLVKFNTSQRSYLLKDATVIPVQDVREIINKRVSAIAERNAATRQTDAPKLSPKQLNLLKNKERALEEIRTGSPHLVNCTTFSLTLRWNMIYSAGERKVQKYEFQWRIDDVSSKDIPEVIMAYSSREDTPDIKETISCVKTQWSNIPRSALDEEKREVYIGGLKSKEGPFVFRVRSKNASGFSSWSPPSRPISTLNDKIKPPKVIMTSPHHFTVNWDQGESWQPFGQVIYYKLWMKKMVSLSEPPMPLGYFASEEFTEIYSGRGTEAILGGNKMEKNKGSGSKGKLSIHLAPRCIFAFKIECRTGVSGRDKRYKSIYKSKTVEYSCPVTVPQAPARIAVKMVSTSRIELEWKPPISNGGLPILLYRVTGTRVGPNSDEDNIQGVFYSGKELQCTLQSTDVDGQQKRYNPTSILPGYQYSFALVAINELGESQPSHSVLTRTLTPEEQEQEINEEEKLKSLRTGSLQEEKEENNETNFLEPSPQSIVNLSEGWQEYWDPKSEHCFYYNSNTGQTQWEHPGHVNGNDRKGFTISAEELRWLKFRKKRFKFLHTLHFDDKRKKLPENDNCLKLYISRSQLIRDSMEKLQHLTAEQLKMKVRVVYIGEEGIDSGGLSKDWFLEVSRQLLSSEYCLFERGSSGVYSINPKSKMMSESIAYFRVLGKLIGKALYDQQLLDIPLCSGLYKKIVGGTININDMKQVDEVFANSLIWILDNDITGVIEQNFSVTVEEFGVHREVDLIPKGRRIAVTEANKKKYVSAILQWKFGAAIGTQLKALLEGIYELIPPQLISKFTPTELEMLMNGKPEINPNELRNGCFNLTGGFNYDSLPVKLFWEAMNEFSNIERGKVVRFITGCNKIPLDGFPPYAPLTITKSTELTKASLPVSHTCFNQLILPPYDNIVILKEKLLYACEHGIGFNLT